MLRVHPSGYYAWKHKPYSDKQRDDQRLLGLLKQAWLESGCVYGYRKLTLDMRAIWVSRAASIVWHVCCAQQVSVHRRAIGAAMAAGAAGLPWWLPII